MEEYEDGTLVGWVLPDNPSSIPSIVISTPGREPVEVEANAMRTDLRDRGLHESGMAGFYLNGKSVPPIELLTEQSEVRDAGTNVLIHRRVPDGRRIDKKLFRFEMQAMPDLNTEKLFEQRFSMYYTAAQQFPQDTFFGIVNNQSARSIYLSGRLNLQQYEHWLRERDFKFITLIRNPLEELAERLLFAAYAAKPDAPSHVAGHMVGLEPLTDLVKNMRFDDRNSIRSALNDMADAQKHALTNPLVRALACAPDELPKSSHVEIALSKLSRFELVGLRTRFGEFKSMCHELLGQDVYGDHTLDNLTWVGKVVEHLSDIKQARNLIALDLDFYSFVEDAISEAIGPAA